MKVEGIDEAIRALEQVRDSLAPEARCEWATRVEGRARELCGDAGGKRISFHCDEKQQIRLLTDKEGKDCLLRAVRELYDSMPLGVQAFFQGVIQTLETP